MKKISFVLVLSLIFNFSGLLYAQNFKGKIQKLTISPSQHKLTLGEKLEYSIEWMGFPAGKIILSVEDKEIIDGRECYHVCARAKPNSFFRTFYDVEYRVDSYIDTKDFSSCRFEKLRRKNKIFNYYVIQFDRNNNLATYSFCSPKGPMENINFSSVGKALLANNRRTAKTTPLSQDALSTLFYFRLIDIKENTVYPLNIFFDEKDWPVNIKVGKLFLKEIRKKGAFTVFKSSAKAGLLNFIGGAGKRVVYFTADAKRIPIQFSTNTRFGPVKGIIQNIPK